MVQLGGPTGGSYHSGYPSIDAIKRMDPIAIYSTDQGNLLIRQDGVSRMSEDHVVIIPHQQLRLFIDALNREYRALKGDIERARKADRAKVPRRISQHGIGCARGRVALLDGFSRSAQGQPGRRQGSLGPRGIVSPGVGIRRRARAPRFGTRAAAALAAARACLAAAFCV